MLPNPAGATEARAIAAAASRAVVAGFREAPAGDEWLVRAYDAKRGTLLWDDQLNVNGGDARANAVAVKGRRTIVAGEVTAAGETNWLVRVYDTKTGETIWADQPSGTTSSGRGAESVVVSGSRVVVGGGAEDGNGNLDWRLRAYDLHAGTLLWEAELDLEGEDDVLVDLAMKGSRLLAGGNVASAEGNQDLFVRVYDTLDGSVEWSDRIDGAAEGDDELTGVWMHGLFSFVSGRVDDDAYAQMNLSKTGIRAWDEAFGSDELDRAEDLTFKGNDIHVVGWTESDGSTDGFVRALDFLTGQLRWEAVLDLEGSDALEHVVVFGSLVYSIGEADREGDRDWLVEVRERY
ncbi:MAG: hypothetical protein FJ144_09435 [Deltaproteobacteria bacterium]|nr:hypothetical protein [Deltaproteobacteria bacterium]